MQLILDYINSLDPVLIFIVCTIFIILESIIPILPLAVFITINTMVLGPYLGFLVSWIATSIGCLISFCIVRKGFKSILDKHHKKIPVINHISFSKLVVIFAIPFMPAFALNIAAGLSKMRIRKFIATILISKISTVYFWSYIGTTLLESVTDIRVILKLVVILYIVYMLSKATTQKYKID